MRLNENQTEKVFEQLEMYSSAVDQLTSMFDQAMELARSDLAAVLSLLDRGDTVYAREHLLRSLLCRGGLEGPQLLEALDRQMKADAERTES